ncbi:cell division protein ZapA [Pontixanthobacter aestiaquae]|uniref:Cell division protein ZapA n=1 Tax=Pontixanthobacter aestiaquae TaxID=1509367 RepID=A0A844Z8Y1_9SPHN|nr:cell division protein ZapA [Pontixanthobacter aestiaquae]MDN3645580.1 cell division protein ZapA [Pontixanthobacter aestiaquae]MXO83423.1 cell division protein ZapA [Pontixanthobacter aestiaquae]
MSEVKLSIGDREYAVACGAGEEDHVSSLGAVINEKIAQLGDSQNIAETQKLLFSALFLADELHETKKSAEAGEAALASQDELKQQISSLQSQLDGMKLAQENHASEVEEVRTELTQRREESEECRSELEKATAHVAGLEQEKAALSAELDEARNASAASGFSATLMDDPDLAPALERFADLLETCADKLEAGAASS